MGRGCISATVEIREVESGKQASEYKYGLRPHY